MAVSETPTLDVERALAADGHDLIVGFDEVGRGSLAGPVMVGAAAVWSRDLPDLTVPDGVADSKMLTERRREAICDPLKDWCAAWAVGAASNDEIDEWGIGHALGVAALRALDRVEHTLGLDGPLGGGAAATPSADSAAVSTVMVGDAPIGTPADVPADVPTGAPSSAFMRVAGILDGPHDYITKAIGTFDAPAIPVAPTMTTMVKGDRHCATVAAAAVIAKVTRDRLMVDIAAAHPEWEAYGWAANKGYGSAAHRRAIADLGPTPLHRISWKLT